MSKEIRAVMIGLALVSSTQPVSAAVTEGSATGFTVSHKGDVRATSRVIWARLARPDLWWNKAHSWSGDARNFSMTLKPGGCFCEKLPQAGFVEHARIIYAAPGKMLRLSGGLGPLQGEALSGTLTIMITPGQDGMTSVAFDYVVGGHARFSLIDIAPAVDRVIGEQHRRLLKLIAGGSPE